MFGNFLSKLFSQNKQSTPQKEVKPQNVTASLEVSKTQIDFERRLIPRLESALSEYPFVKKDKIAFLAKAILHDKFSSSKNKLSVDEKKALNLNTRMQYAKEFIECFEDVANLDVELKFFCRNLLCTERTILWALDEIEKLKRDGFVKKVKLEGKGAWNNKVYPISKIPKIEKVDYTEEQVLFFAMAKIEI